MAKKKTVNDDSALARPPTRRMTVVAQDPAVRRGGNSIRNVVERAMLLARGDWLQASSFPALVHGPASAGGADFPLPACGLNLDALEQSLVAQALERCGGNSTRAGGLLGLNRDQVRYRVEKYRLPRLQHA